MHPGPPVTLGDLVREDKLLWAYCCDRGRSGMSVRQRYRCQRKRQTLM
jgi:hypothetical protein